MSYEPIYLAQSADPMTKEQSHQWFGDRVRDARDKGCKHLRACIHETIPNLRLLEGWEQSSRDVMSDGQGEPRWQLTAREPVAA